MFDTLGVPPLVGRTLTVANDQRGGGPDGPVAVISYAFWQRRFGGAANPVGQALTLDGVPVMKSMIGSNSPTHSAGQTEEHDDRVTELGHFVVNQVADASAHFGPRNGRDLIDHEP
jgi:hypothetical protein